MAQVVQAKCPNCNNVLRIPAEWLHQPMRCKYCQHVFQARPKPGKGKASYPVAKPAAPPPSAVQIPSPLTSVPFAQVCLIDTERALRSRSYMARAVDCRGRPSGRPAAGPEGPALRTE